MKVGKLGWLVAMFLSGGMAVAQGTVDDYRRAYALKEKFSADKVFYSNVNPQWIEGTHQFWYVRNTPDGRLYVSVDADKKARKELLSNWAAWKAGGVLASEMESAALFVTAAVLHVRCATVLHMIWNQEREKVSAETAQLDPDTSIRVAIAALRMQIAADRKTEEKH